MSRCQRITWWNAPVKTGKLLRVALRGDGSEAGDKRMLLNADCAKKPA
jgi:hypothetical protein